MRWRFQPFSLCSVASAAFLLAVAPAQAAITLYEDALDDSSANILLLGDSDTTADFIDYSNFTVDGIAFGLSEAPNSVAGGTATRGLLMRANLVSNTAQAVTAVLGTTPVSFSGNYQLSYDVFMSSNITQAGAAGTTEQALFGIGTDGIGALEARSGGAGRVGTWGWLANENGYGTEDTAVFENDTELADLGDTVLGEAAPFIAAFNSDYGLTNPEPGGEWVRVDVESINGNVSVRFNGVEFFNVASSATDGFAMFGYEDPFASLSNPTAQNWAVFDNIVVTAVPEPGTGSLVLLTLGAVVFRRRRWAS